MRRVGITSKVFAVAVLALAAVACSRLYGIKVRGEASSPVPPACVAAALAGIEPLQRTQHRDDWVGWELVGPAGKTRVDLVGERELSVSWARINQPWPAEDCVRMRPFVAGLYDRVRAGCTALPASPREVELPCAD